ncbi:MAG: DUF177 domain-containing protein, partial [Proteobacteria bacterium]|nr:DUF177 domain-containing protein [Pseudomonadota bacterium]
ISNKKNSFKFNVNHEQKTKICLELNLVNLQKFSFTGHLLGTGKGSWLLEAKINAVVTQSCIVTFENVTTKISEPVKRLFIKDLLVIDGSESDFLSNIEKEKLTDKINLLSVATEELILSIPLYPRLKNLEPLNQNFPTSEIKELIDSNNKPFASLASLAKKMKSQKD